MNNFGAARDCRDAKTRRAEAAFIGAEHALDEATCGENWR